MPKPKSKSELIEQSQQSYQALTTLINSYPSDIVAKEFNGDSLNRNTRDVIAHLHQWHLFLCDWYKVGMIGNKPNMPAEGFTWQTIPALNVEVREKHKDLSLAKAQKLLKSSYLKVQVIIDKHTDEELFEKKRYAWTGSTSLGAYLIMNSVSHYKWAIKLIKKSMK